jgi:hypothetical protein
LKVKRRAVPVGAVVVVQFTEVDTVTREVISERCLIEGLNAETEVIQVVLAATAAGSGQEIDERCTCPKVIQADFGTEFIRRAAKDLTIELHHALRIGTTDYDVVETEDLHAFRIPQSSPQLSRHALRFHLWTRPSP